jgi:hypothetical protein
MKWEYRNIKLEAKGVLGREIDQAQLDAVLNPLGNDGWELVTAVGIHEGAGYTREVVLIFKRQAK